MVPSEGAGAARAAGKRPTTRPVRSHRDCQHAARLHTPLPALWGRGRGYGARPGRSRLASRCGAGSRGAQGPRGLLAFWLPVRWGFLAAMVSDGEGSAGRDPPIPGLGALGLARTTQMENYLGGWVQPVWPLGGVADVFIYSVKISEWRPVCQALCYALGNTVENVTDQGPRGGYSLVGDADSRQVNKSNFEG